MNPDLVPAALCVPPAWKLLVLAAGNSLQKPEAAAEPCKECEVCSSVSGPHSARCCDGSGPASPQKNI